MVDSTTTMIRGGVVLRGPTLEPVEGLAVVVEGERIVRIARESEIAKGAGWRVIDAAGHTVMPGLIDAHLHFFGSRSPDPMMWAIEPKMLNCARAVSDAASCSISASPRCATSARGTASRSSARSTKDRSWGRARSRRISD
jgi:imidazolonepropionase-like amidohydrolase